MKLKNFVIIFIVGLFLGNIIQTQISFAQDQTINNQTAIQSVKDADGNVLYNGTIYHIFFHS